MTINTENLVSITETNQNFSRVARIVDKTEAAVVPLTQKIFVIDYK